MNHSKLRYVKRLRSLDKERWVISARSLFPWISSYRRKKNMVRSARIRVARKWERPSLDAANIFDLS